MVLIIDNFLFGNLIMLYFLSRYTYQKSNCKINRQKRQCGGKKLMFWGIVMPNGLIFLLKINGNLNASGYLDILHNYGVRVMNLNMKENYSFVQDNCRSHKAKLTKEYLASQSFQVLN